MAHELGDSRRNGNGFGGMKVLAGGRSIRGRGGSSGGQRVVPVAAIFLPFSPFSSALVAGEKRNSSNDGDGFGRRQFLVRGTLAKVKVEMGDIA